MHDAFRRVHAALMFYRYFAGLLLLCGVVSAAWAQNPANPSGLPYGGLAPSSETTTQSLSPDDRSGNTAPSGQLTSDPLAQQPLPSGVTLQNGARSTNSGAENATKSPSDQVLEPPPNLTPFQRLAAASTGKILPVFGATLFSSNVPSTFAPVDRVPVTPEYVVGPGDELLIRLWGQVTLDSRFVIDRSGDIYIPRVGAVHVAGLPFAQLQEFLRSQVARNFKNFDINVNIGQLRSIQVFVVGNARRPGNYTISSLSTLVNALFASGGPSTTGSMRRIQVKRGGSPVGEFDFYDLLLKGDKSRDIPLLSGDVIYIPPVGPMVAIAGSVDVPAVYELRGETTVGEAIALAGGLSTLADNKSVRIERIDQAEQQRARSVLDVSLDEAGRAATLRDGDILVVSPIIDRFKDAVTLRGNVATPSRFRWFPHMRVRDLIPDKDALLTRDYWQRHNRLGLPVLDATPQIRQDAPIAPGESILTMVPFQSLNSAAAQPLAVPVRDSDTAIYASQSPLNLYDPAAAGNGYSAPGVVPQGTGVNGQTTTAPGSGAAGQARNQNNEGALALQRNQYTTTGGGASVSSGVTESSSTFQPRNTVVLSAPDIDWAYAVVERLNRADLTTKLLPFNLGKLVLENDETQNYELEPGDVVTVFSKADIRVPQSQQTKYIRLEGEFVASGIYSVGPKETLRQVVERAGGFSRNAYLYGSEFTRESTRVLQQERLYDYTNSLERHANIVEANSLNNAGGPQDIAAVQSSVQDARSMVVKLRGLRASGRIVLQLKPNSSGLDSLPDLPLEDGDTFVVPSVPSNVDVFGAVYNQNSFLYDPRRRVGDYLREAGGATRTADAKRAYIVRADGSIVSRQYSSSLFSGGFNGTRMNPGDAIVLPEVVYKRSALRQLVDISTIIGQLGLGAAAIYTVAK